MNWKGHVMGGFVAAGIFLLIFLSQTDYTINLLEAIVIAVIVFIYSQLPDLDTQASLIRKVFAVAAGVGIIVSVARGEYAISVLVAVALIAVFTMLKHKGFMHRHLTGLLLSSPLYLMSPLSFYVGIVSYSSHLVIDGITNKKPGRKR